MFIEIPGNPDGVEVSPVDGKVYVNTVGPVGGAPDPADGGIYALTKDDITNKQAAAAGRRRSRCTRRPRLHRGGAMLNTQIKPRSSEPDLHQLPRQERDDSCARAGRHLVRSEGAQRTSRSALGRWGAAGGRAEAVRPRRQCQDRRGHGAGLAGRLRRGLRRLTAPRAGDGRLGEPSPPLLCRYGAGAALRLTMVLTPKFLACLLDSTRISNPRRGSKPLFPTWLEADNSRMLELTPDKNSG